MTKFLCTLVRRRRTSFLISVAAALLCAVLMLFVPVNTDLTVYLPDSSSMKKGLDLLREEFPALSLTDSSVRLMFSDLSEEDTGSVLEYLNSLEYVSSAACTPSDPAYGKGSYTLYSLTIPFDYASRELKSTVSAIRDEFEGEYPLEVSIDDPAGGKVPLPILIFAIIMIFFILFVMSASWIEPVLFLVSAGCAILINMGTNIVLGSVSITTWQIGALLQLVLAMDYSIILMDRFRQEKKTQSSSPAAMEKAIISAFSSITGSSLTTVAGLLALVFMSFKIGADMGIVLAKGVLCSMICVFTLLPFLILTFEPLIIRFSKKVPSFKMIGLSTFSYRFRYPALILFIVYFISMAILKGNTPITFTMSEPNNIDAVFPKVNQILLLYDNADEEGAAAIAEEMAHLSETNQVLSWGTTLGASHTSEELCEVLPEMVELFPQMASRLPQDEDSALTNLDIEALSAALLPAGLSEKIASVSPEQAEELLPLAVRLLYYDASREGTSEETLVSPQELTAFLQDDLLSLDVISSLADPKQLSSIKSLIPLMGPLLGTEDISGEQLYNLLAFSPFTGNVKDVLTPEAADLLCRLCAANTSAKPDTSMTMYDLLTFAGGQLGSDGLYGSLAASEEAKEQLSSISGALDKTLESVRSFLCGPKHSLMVILAQLPDESDETTAYCDRLDELIGSHLSETFHLIGNTLMAREMASSFKGELNSITWITAAAIFFVVLLTFRNLLIPVILVVLIQASVYATMVVINLQGQSIYYLALLMVQSILMGAAIDYAILFTNFYREYRLQHDIPETLKLSYQGAINTILTSGSIIVIITFILGYAFPNPAIGEICHTISMGSSCALIAILLILPGTLAVLDRFIVKRTGA